MARGKIASSTVSAFALVLLGGCATSAATGETSDASAELQGPTAEEIATIARADALTRANFWNKHYNLHPTDREVSLSFIRALRDIGSYERAAEVAGLATVTHPLDFDLHMELGRAEFSEGNPAEAIQAFVRASAINPDAAGPFAAVARIYDADGQHDVAQQTYREALQRDRNRPATLSNYGLSLALSDRLEEAEDVMREAVALEDATVQVRQNFALVLGLLGKFDEAREVAAKDAPARLADRNVEFLANMIGEDARFQDIANRSVTAPAETPAPASDIPVAA
ncbi:MAG: tetratricopeptide repeat protein, partial [Pseudomonadota bacterium]